MDVSELKREPAPTVQPPPYRIAELNFMDRSLNDRAQLTVKSSHVNLNGTHAGTLYAANNFVNQLDAKKPEKREKSPVAGFRNADPVDIDAEIDEHPYKCKCYVFN